MLSKKEIMDIDRRTKKQEAALKIVQKNKKYKNKSPSFTLTFQCDLCNFMINEMNGNWKNVPKKCPKCPKGKIKEIIGTPINAIDGNRGKYWENGKSNNFKADVYSDEKSPY